MLCPQCDLPEAVELAESLRRKLQRTPIPALRGACITASFGVTIVRPSDNEESAIARADRGLLLAKESGRDRVISIPSDEEVPVLHTAAPPPSDPEEILIEESNGRVQADVVSFVPKTIVYDKVLGFAQEFLAVITHAEEDVAVFEVDCKNTPFPREPQERPGKHRLNISMNEVELRGGHNKNKLRHGTLIRIVVNSINSRDRREESAQKQCIQLLKSLQSYLLAEPFTESLQADLIRIVKPTKETRY
jgi:hypothetical protein